jgi:hypothetical protein
MKYNLVSELRYGASTVAEALPMLVNPVDGRSEKKGGYSAFFENARDDRKLEKLVNRSIHAYVVDGIVRQSVDKMAESYIDIRLIGGTAQMNYLRSRLDIMGLAAGEDWKTTFSRALHDLWKAGNGHLIKIRGNVKGAVRPLYETSPRAIVGLFLVSPNRLEPKLVDGYTVWKLKDKAKTEPIKLMIPGSTDLPRSKAKLEGTMVDTKEGEMLAGRDIVHLAYKKPSDGFWGIGFTFSALEDVVQLRSLEQNVAIMAKKNGSPLYHHIINRAMSPGKTITAEIQGAAMLHRTSAPEGVIVTGPGHEIKVIGAESHALRFGEYLKYYSNRCFAGLGVTPFLMGFETGTLGAAEAAKELIVTKIRFGLAEAARTLETFILWEMLWEGGWDPYAKESDRVYLEFVDIDETRRHKKENQAADLYTKSLIDLQEARVYAGWRTMPQPSLMYLNQVEIPKAKAGVKAQAPAKKTSSSNSKLEPEELEQVFEYLPTDRQAIPQFGAWLRIRFDETIVPVNFEEQAAALFDDPEALKEYLIQEFLSNG